ncbi:MAG TPA: nitroreductase family deazaflavin-dependent oxidoreductase [Acidimicrobiia bacterium]|nr:nitroreductase family deazaflavin-dependent oxidoreductase [Acidimicrobiia bacterium]
MAKEYKVTRNVNRLMAWAARRGMGKTQLMTTTGRKSGQKREVPVSPLVLDGAEYLVSPYGEVSWVHNVRANPLVTLRHGSKERQVRLEEMTGPTAASAAAAYYERESFARPYMDVPENPSAADFAAKSALFPVFKVNV